VAKLTLISCRACLSSAVFGSRKPGRRGLGLRADDTNHVFVRVTDGTATVSWVDVKID